jgi:uncharacterized membrane protein
MTKGRMEAFSDGVIAIIITIMVLELHVPHEASWQALYDMLPIMLMYALSYVFLGIYWVNHHHLLHATERVSGSILWANLHLLFWLSLTPFATAWMGQHHAETLPNVVYGGVLLASAIAYYVLQRRIIAAQGAHSRLAAMVGRDFKGKLSPVVYVLGIVFAYVSPTIAQMLYAFVALIWLIPDRRIERNLA